VVFKYHDKGIGEWDLSGHQANVKEINTTKAMWEQKKMLIQHGDMSGKWTAEQRKMIEGMVFFVKRALRLAQPIEDAGFSGTNHSTTRAEINNHPNSPEFVVPTSPYIGWDSANIPIRMQPLDRASNPSFALTGNMSIHRQDNGLPHAHRPRPGTEPPGR
jgi:hypothetical protein